MSYTRHHAIVVTSYDSTKIRKARKKAREIGLSISGLIWSPWEDYSSFLVGPDGFNENREESEKGDNQRHQFIDWLEMQEFDDGSSCFAWAEIQYGDGDRDTHVTRSSDERARQYT